MVSSRQPTAAFMPGCLILAAPTCATIQANRSDNACLFAESLDIGSKELFSIIYGWTDPARLSLNAPAEAPQCNIR